MIAYLIKRFGRAALTIFGVVTLVFLLIRLIPGDPVEAILGDDASPEDRQAMRSALALDRPFAQQYVTFLGTIANGTLGHSFRHPSASVTSLITDVLTPTVLLAISALLLAWLIAIPLGIFAATRHNTPWDQAASTLAVAGLAIPNIWLGPLLILLFGVTLRWLPLPGDDPTRLNALILPSLTIGTALAASLFRHTRSVMIEVLKQQYILAAKARGVPTSRVLFQHSLRNALLPIMTVGAAQLGALLSGTVIAEKIFERPGLGTLFLEAFFARDIPIIQGCVLVVAVVYVSINLAVDLLYGVVDPRVRLS